MIKLPELIRGEIEAKTYIFQSTKPLEEIRQAVEKEGYAFFHIDGKEITNTQTFLSHAKIDMKFPDYFGMNWNAFNDCLMDFSWHPAKGYVILYDEFHRFSEADPDNFSIATNIMNGAAREGEGKMYFLFRGDTSKLPSTISKTDIVTY